MKIKIARQLHPVKIKEFEVSEHTAAMGSELVDLVTGEIINPVYEAFRSVANTDDKRMYSATVRSAHECTDPDQLADVMKYTTDQRGLKVKSDLTWFKKESDYRVRTLKEEAIITTPQYKFMKQLVECISYKNIILCKRSFLCAKLGIDERVLSRKLRLVESWVQQKDCKKGFIKLLVAPMLGYKGRGSGIKSSNLSYYVIDPQTQYNALYVPFFGPMPQPFVGVLEKETFTFRKTVQFAMGKDFYDSPENISAGDWWDKEPKENEQIDVDFEKWFAHNIGADLSEYFKEDVPPAWVTEQFNHYEEYQDAN